MAFNQRQAFKRSVATYWIASKRYNLMVFDYLTYVFERISTAKSDKDYEQLTPKFAQEFVPKLKPDKKDQVETQQTDNSDFQKNP